MPTSSPVVIQKSSELPETERLCAQLAAANEERERLGRELELRNCALDAASTHFMIIDVCGPRWVIVYANRAVARCYGYEPSELLGQSPEGLVDVVADTASLERIRAAVRAGTSASTELVGRRKDGTTFWVGMFMAPIRNADGVIAHYVGIGADITTRLAQERAQRQLQEQLHDEMHERARMTIELQLAQKLESVGRLAAGIAHEINTPIQYIGDSVSFLQSAQVDQDRLLAAYRLVIQLVADYQPARNALAAATEMEKALDLEFLAKEIPRAFDRTLQGVSRVTEIVRAMKEFAHPGSAEHSPADLNHAVETTLTVAHNEYKYSAQIETSFGELPPVTCNVGELNQVFLNLIVNAAHAIAESGKDAATGRISIATVRAGAEVVLTFADNGCGIPADDLAKIFDPFFTTKPVGRGTGQGLAIAHSIVNDKHGGSIDVQSVVGGGTRFSLRLPITGSAAARIS
jgi:two-component system NtrC family sensor kinase